MSSVQFRRLLEHFVPFSCTFVILLNILPLGTHAQRGLQYLVGLSVCVCCLVTSHLWSVCSP